MKYNAKEILNIKSTLGECPLWSIKNQVLYFVDILKPAMYCFNPVTKDLKEYEMPEAICCIGLREEGGFIAGMKTGVFLLNDEGQIIQKVADNPTDASKSRFNDGKVDPWGHFWCGTIWESGSEKNAKICRIEKEKLDFSIVIENLNISNGIAFTSDKNYIYYTNTPDNSLYKMALEKQTGNPIGESKLVYHFGSGQPDGASFDNDGNYWSAQFGDGLILCLSPEGKIIHEVQVPVKQVTMVAFGGEDLDMLFITTARENMSKEDLEKYPQSGNLFSVKVDAKGRKEPVFKG